MNRRFVRIVGLFLTTLFLCGCQSTPEKGVVASKNNGFFEVALENKQGLGAESSCTETQFYNQHIVTSDIDWTIELEFQIFNLAPVLQVRPEQIDEDTAKKIGEVLFNGSTIYEYSTARSKSELEELILGLRQFISDRTTLIEYYGGDEAIADIVIADYETRISDYEQEYADAPDDVIPQLCEWVFHPRSYYEDSSNREAAKDISYNKTKTIEAMGTIDGLPYFYKVFVRDESDYRSNMVFYYIDDLSVPETVLYANTTPTEKDIVWAKEQAEMLLAEMNLGDWVTDSCEVYSYPLSNGETGYRIIVNMAPVYEKIKVTRQDQLENLMTDDPNASNYKYEAIQFDFATDRLLAFEYQGGLEMVGIVNNAVQLLDAQTVMENFEQYIGMLQAEQLTTWECDKLIINVDSVEFGLCRTRIKNNQNDFYLVPAYTFSGTVTPVDDKGKVITVTDQHGDTVDPSETVTLAVINAVDGTVINTKLGY